MAEEVKQGLFVDADDHVDNNVTTGGVGLDSMEPLEDSFEEIVNEDEPEQDWKDPTKPELSAEETALHLKKRLEDSQAYIEELKGKTKDVNLEEVEQLKALKHVIENDPELLSQVTQRVTGKKIPASDPGYVPQRQAWNMPKPPEDFDPQEMHDPNTESGKWFYGLQQSQQQQIRDEVERLVNSKLGRYQEAQVNAQKSKALQDFVQQKKIDDKEREAFEAFMQKGPSRELTPKDMFQIYSLIERGQISGQKSSTDIDKKFEQVTKTARPSAANVSSSTPQPKNDNQLFNEGLKQYANRRKKWKIG